MRKLLMIPLLLVFGTQIQAQDDIKGIWMTQEAKSKIEIYEKEGRCFGKVVWLKEPNDRKGNPKTDQNNPDKSLRGREILGSDMLTELKYEEGAWRGKLYAARKGRTLDVAIRTRSADVLDLEVSVRGFSRTQQWSRDTL